jgi:hypothetical protein
MSWSTWPWQKGTTTFSSACSINRYYDPSTDQFLSVDPDVQETDQPYAFVNDDPLNAEDPLGMKGSIGSMCNGSKFCETTDQKIIEKAGSADNGLISSAVKAEKAVASTLKTVADAISDIPGVGATSEGSGFVSGLLTIQLDAYKGAAYTIGDLVGGALGTAGGIALGGLIGAFNGASEAEESCGPECAPEGFVGGAFVGAASGGYIGAKLGISAAEWVERRI